MSNYEVIQLEDIKWNNEMSDIIKKSNLTLLEISKPTKDVINKIKNNDKEIYSLMKKSFDKNLNVVLDSENNIITGFKEIIAYTILGYKEILITKSNNNYLYSEYNDYENDNNYSESEPNYYHFDTDGEPEESNDVWEYGDAYKLNNS